MKQIFVCLLFIYPGANMLRAQEVWTQQQSGTSAMLTTVTFGSNLFVAGGEEGSVITSADGVHWKPQASGITSHINAMAYGAGKFVAVSADGTIITSAKGNQWTATYTADMETTLHAVAYCSDRFIAGGKDVLLESVNGTDWKMVEGGAPDAGGWNIYGISCGKGITVAVTMEGSTLVAKNNSGWKAVQPDGGTGFIAVTFGQGKFIAVTETGVAFSSTDGEHWKSKAMLERSPLTVSNILFAANTFLVVGSPGLIIVSKDGNAWKELLPDTSGDLLTAGFGNNQFIITGSMGLVMSSKAGL